MQFEDGKLYHIYNIGNQKQKIFYRRDNYLFFLKKMRNYLIPVCDILAWCLMPNHFHLLIAANQETVKQASRRKNPISQFSENLRLLLSQYTKTVNKQENLTGSLFRQNTKSKSLFQINTNRYALVCFHYIHRNPLNAGLVSSLFDWEFSSFLDHAEVRNGTMCNRQLAKTIINYDEINLELQTLSFANSDYEKFIWQ